MDRRQAWLTGWLHRDRGSLISTRRPGPNRYPIWSELKWPTASVVPDHADLLRTIAAYRPRLYDTRLRRARPVHAPRRARRHFLTGTDEHGQKVEKAAPLAGWIRSTFTDQGVAKSFRDLAT